MAVVVGPPVELLTERLRLRPWREADKTPFAELNADPSVMEFFPARLTRAESDAFVDSVADYGRRFGWGLWATELRDGGAFIGFVGLQVPRRVLPCSPCVEIGWRLARPAWGRGLASEAAEAALRFGFERLGLDEIVSFTTLTNLRSQAVMRRIGVARDDAGDFDHPAVPEGDPLRPHCLYRLARDEWLWRRGVAG